jgi:hypothetical protein
MGLEGIVSKRTDAPYRSWLKSKNPASAAVRREREEEWRNPPGMLSPVICSSCAVRVHQADNRATASTARLRTMVAIPATSMLVIRLDAMHHSSRHSSDGFDLDHAVSGWCAGSTRRSGDSLGAP